MSIEVTAENAAALTQKLLAETGLSNADAAERCGVTRTYFYTQGKQHNVPRLDRFARLAGYRVVVMNGCGGVLCEVTAE